MAAVLRFAGDAVAGARSAGALWGMLDELPPVPEVLVVGRNAQPQAEVRIHRVRELDERDIRWRHGVPVTSPARTVVDLTPGLSPLETENVLAICFAKGLATASQIRQTIERVPARKPGVGTLRRLLERGGHARTRSDYERRLLELIAQAGLPRPLTNHRIATHEVDMVWLDRRLVLEFDGFKFHSDRRAFERDRRRDQDLVAAGYRVLRVTARQLEEEPLAVIARLAVALAV
ncbi:MAG TPA: DUF559 domain-containing protein [Solirubrobacteraceae bacterium]|nr:DUF559 domain-containing protein [Solirubrobacteraceae bacterium]